MRSVRWAGILMVSVGMAVQALAQKKAQLEAGARGWRRRFLRSGMRSGGS